MLAIWHKTPRWCPTRAQNEGATAWSWTQELQYWKGEAQRSSPNSGEDPGLEKRGGNGTGGGESYTDGACVGVSIFVE